MPVGHNVHMRNFLKIDKHIWISQCWLREENTHYLLYGYWMFFHLNKLESHSPKDAKWQVWLKLVQWFLRRSFLNFVNFFYYFVIISPWKRAGPFIWTNLSPLNQRTHCTKFCSNNQGVRSTTITQPQIKLLFH